jgi:hypothetical protein
MKRDDKVTTAFTLLSYVVRSFVRCVAKPNKDSSSSSSSTFSFFLFRVPRSFGFFFLLFIFHRPLLHHISSRRIFGPRSAKLLFTS